MGFNRGEWSELYTFLHLLINPNLEIVDEHLKLINNSTFQVMQIELEDKTRYKIQKDNNITKIRASGVKKVYLIDNLKEEKDIQKLIALTVKNDDEYNFYKKKIADFANVVTFGMRASERWNGTNEVNGGIIIVTKTGEVYLLDLIYFKTVVDKYLIDNIKLDSPSSTRYKMFEIYKESGRYYFKLNLQVRFK